MDTLLPDIQNWFLRKEEYFVAFAEVDSRIEGWFKAEMIVLLNQLSRQGKIERFEREFNISKGSGKRNQIDFKLHLHGQTHFCELKALCISQATGTPRNLSFYFRDDDMGIIKDLKKLDELSGKENRWVLAFVYPSPNPTEWNDTIASLSDSLKHWECITKPQNFPEFAFLALWEQRQKVV